MRRQKLRQEKRVSLVAACGGCGTGPGMGGACGRVQSHIILAQFSRSTSQS